MNTSVIADAQWSYFSGANTGCVSKQESYSFHRFKLLKLNVDGLLRHGLLHFHYVFLSDLCVYASTDQVSLLLVLEMTVPPILPNQIKCTSVLIQINAMSGHQTINIICIEWPFFSPVFIFLVSCVKPTGCWSFNILHAEHRTDHFDLSKCSLWFSKPSTSPFVILL